MQLPGLAPKASLLAVVAGWVLMGRVAADPCNPSPCQNGADCVASGTSYSCQCMPGWTGANCTDNIEDCSTNPCSNNGTCTDKLDGFECSCLFGYTGPKCETEDYYTLQQWTSNECGGPPWRCFKLKVGECIDTGFTDGNMPNRANWWGKLEFDGNNHYTIDLCWWGADAEEEEKCKCDNHYANVPKLGRNSLGPPSSLGTDSDRCHKLLKITSSRLVKSTGMGAIEDGEPSNLLCGEPGGAHRMMIPANVFQLLAVLLALPAAASAVNPLAG